MGWQQLTIAVKARKASGTWSIGTGFPVARGLILTAWHIVEPDSRPTEIRVRWWHCGLDKFSGTDRPNLDGYLDARMVWKDSELDVALLEAPHPEGLGFVRLSTGMPRPTTYECEGFPKFAWIRGQVSHFRTGGEMHTLDGSGRLFQVRARDDPKEPEGWGGLSGALVFPNDPLAAEDHAVGILTDARPTDANNSALFAVPTAVIKATPGFAEAVRSRMGADPVDEAWCDDRRQTLLDHLEGCIHGIGANDLTAILKRCGLPDRESENTNYNWVAQELLKIDNVIQRLFECQLNIPGLSGDSKHKIGDVICMLSTIRMFEQEKATIRRIFDLGDAFDLECRIARTATSIELVAAAVDAGRPEFLPRDVEEDLPRGRMCVQHVTPECGPDGDPSGAILVDMARRSGVLGYGDDALTQRVGDELLHPRWRLLRSDPRSVGEPLDNATIGRIRKILQQRRKVGKRSFYVIVELPADPDDSRIHADGVARLREQLGPVLTFALAAGDPGEEDDDLIFLKYTVPLKDDPP